MQRRLDEAKEQGLREGKAIGFEVGFEKGEKQGLITGNKQTEVVVNLFNQLCTEMETELTELRLLVNNKNVENTKKQENNYDYLKEKSDKKLIEEHLFYFRAYSEIKNSNFFNDVLHQSSTSKSIMDIIAFLDFLIHSNEVKITYPDTHKLLPDLKKAYERLYENKLVVEEAEGLL